MFLCLFLSRFEPPPRFIIQKKKGQRIGQFWVVIGGVPSHCARHKKSDSFFLRAVYFIIQRFEK